MNFTNDLLERSFIIPSTVDCFFDDLKRLTQKEYDDRNATVKKIITKKELDLFKVEEHNDYHPIQQSPPRAVVVILCPHFPQFPSRCNTDYR